MATTQKIVLSAQEHRGYTHAEHVSQATADKVTELLMDNHEQFHTYFFAGILHNHIVHHLLASYSLNASPEEVQKAYDVNSAYQRPAPDQTSAVAQNLHKQDEFQKCLGKEGHYSDFLTFFASELDNRGTHETIHEYLFKGDERADDMLVRLFGGFLHPIIHLGYALEFGQPLLVAEALASTAVHDSSWMSTIFFPPEKLARQRTRQSNPTLVSLLERLRNDPVISTAVRPEDGPNKITEGLLPRAGNKLAEYLAEYTVAPDELQQKTAEMIHTSIYALACAQRPKKIPMFDFFLMHGVNTSIFFPVFMQQDWISDANKCRLLEWKARLDLALYAGCRTPKLYPSCVEQYQPKTDGDWDSIFRRATKYKDDGHTSKLIRALKNGENVTASYAGKPGFPLASNAFLKIAHMVMDSVERMDEPDYKLPMRNVFVKGLNEEVIRIIVRWVRWCGLDSAWEDVPASSGSAMSKVGTPLAKM